MIGEMPCSLVVHGNEYDIETDFRWVLKTLAAFNDPDLENSEKALVCLMNTYLDFDTLPQDDYEEAFREALRFIDNGVEQESDRRPAPRIMDWEQDERLLFPAINKVAGFETRSAEYVHWWTFLGWYMEISEGVFSNILSLRLKRAKHKKLEKWEQEFWSANKDICVLRERLSEEEKAERERLQKLLG